MSGENFKLLKIYVNEDTKYEGHNLYHYLTLKLRKMGIKGVTVIRGIEGFGENKELHTTSIVDLSFDLPVVIEVIDTEEKISKALLEISNHINKGLITITDINIIKFTNN